MVAPCQIEGGCNLTLVSSVVLVEPDAKCDREPELRRDLWNALQTLSRSVRTHGLCVCGDLGEVGADLRFGYSQTVRRWFGKPVV